MATFVHFVKRLALVIVGYVAGVILGLLATAGIYSALALLPGAPDYFVFVAASAIAAIAAPPVGFFIVLVAMALTAMQAGFAALISEVFALRSPWLHLLFGILVAGSGYLTVGQGILNSSALDARGDLAMVAAGGAFSGLVYWLIAGRRAGLRPPSPTA